MDDDDGKNVSEYDWRFNNLSHSDCEDFWDSEEDDGLWEAEKEGDCGITVGKGDIHTPATQAKQLRREADDDEIVEAIWDGRVQVQVGNLDAEAIEGSTGGSRSSKRMRRASAEDKVIYYGARYGNFMSIWRAFSTFICIFLMRILFVP